jgi:hypothetical protein
MLRRGQSEMRSPSIPEKIRLTPGVRPQRLLFRVVVLIAVVSRNGFDRMLQLFLFVGRLALTWRSLCHAITSGLFCHGAGELFPKGAGKTGINAEDFAF